MTTMKMYSKEGNVMMDTRSLRREGDNLIMKGKMMEDLRIFGPAKACCHGRSSGICP